MSLSFSEILSNATATATTTTTTIHHDPRQDSNLTQKMLDLASHSLRLASSALYRATSYINGESANRLTHSAEPILDVVDNADADDDDAFTTTTTTAATTATEETGPAVPTNLRFPTSESTVSMMSVLSDSPETDDSIEFGPHFLPVVSMEEVSRHGCLNDAWMVVYDRVYDFTAFLTEHPGGREVMEEYAGYDGTLAFRGVGHSTAALKMMDSYLIGILPDSQRLYRNKNDAL